MELIKGQRYIIETVHGVGKYLILHERTEFNDHEGFGGTILASKWQNLTSKDVFKCAGGWTFENIKSIISTDMDFIEKFTKIQNIKVGERFKYQGLVYKRIQEGPNLACFNPSLSETELTVKGFGNNVTVERVECTE